MQTKNIQSASIGILFCLFLGVSACAKKSSEDLLSAVAPSKLCSAMDTVQLKLEEVPANEVATIADATRGGRHRFVKFNPEEAFATLSGALNKRVQVPLFDDKILELEIEGVKKYSLRNVVITGRISGTAMSSATLVINKNVMQGHFHNMLTGEHYEINYEGNGIHSVDQDVQSGNGEDDCLAIPAPQVGEDGNGENDNSPVSINPVIDMLVAYTPSAKAKKGGTAGIEALIQMGIADTNQAFANSGVALSVRLVGTLELTQNETGNYSSDLSSLQGKTDGLWDAVHAERVRLGADQVTVVAVYPNSTVAGIGYIGASSSYAFTVVKTSAFNQYTFSHELGHNIGLNHSDGLENLQGAFRTIMAYGSQPRIPYFSSPFFSYNGYKTGDSTHNSAKILNSNGGTTANLVVSKLPMSTTTTTMPTPVSTTMVTTTTLQTGGGMTTTTMPSSPPATQPGSKPVECVN